MTKAVGRPGKDMIAWSPPAVKVEAGTFALGEKPLGVWQFYRGARRRTSTVNRASHLGCQRARPQPLPRGR